MFITHNDSYSPEYRAWYHMKARCYNMKNKGYKIYGGRGIKVCDRWLHSYENFLHDMGRRPSINHSIDRKDVDGNYSPENCRWATAKQQRENTRSIIKVDFNGEQVCLKRWAEHNNVKYKRAFYWFKKGYSTDQILTRYGRI